MKQLDKPWYKQQNFEIKSHPPICVNSCKGLMQFSKSYNKFAQRIQAHSSLFLMEFFWEKTLA